MKDVPVLTFLLAGERCAIAASQTREVVRAVAPTRLPKAPPIVAGVLNLRGELIPLLDVRRRFGLPPRAVAVDDHIIIATAAGRAVAFAVDHALDLAWIPQEEIRDAADVAIRTEYVSGLARLPDGLLVIHDLQTFLSAEESAATLTALAGARPS